MIAEALEFLKNKFVAAEEPKQVEVFGRTYYDKQLHEVRNPDVACYGVSTLTGIVGLLAVKAGNLSPADVLLSVDGPCAVSLASVSVDEWGKRQIFGNAKAQLPLAFKYGEYVDQEPFMIALQTCFKPTPDRDYLISIASSLTSDVVAQGEDNGIAQRVALKSGVALRETAELRPVVTLAPFRTFYEVDQPQSQFLFRVKQAGAGQIPKLTLIEADGGAWKLEATRNVAFFLVDAIAKLGEDLQSTPVVS